MSGKDSKMPWLFPESERRYPVLVSFTDDRVVVVQAEGTRIGLVTCEKCGVALVLDAEKDVMEIHREWHEGVR